MVPAIMPQKPVGNAPEKSVMKKRLTGNTLLPEVSSFNVLYAATPPIQIHTKSVCLCVHVCVGVRCVPLRYKSLNECKKPGRQAERAQRKQRLSFPKEVG